MNYELANDEDGEPFMLPLHATGWRVKRLAPNGGGRPKLVRWRNGLEHGQPMVIPLASTYDDLLEAAGPGRYRLEPVGADRKTIEGAPVASTGHLGEGDDEDDELDDSAPKGRRQREAYDRDQLFAHFLENNQRMTASALQQTTAVLQGAAQLLAAAHSSGITSRPAHPVPYPVMVAAPAPVEDDEDEHEDDEDEDEDDEHLPDEAHPVEPPAAPNPLSGVAQSLVHQVMSMVLPLLMQKLASMQNIAGMPLEALGDWRKAAPDRFPQQAPPAPPRSVYTVDVAEPVVPPHDEFAAPPRRPEVWTPPPPAPQPWLYSSPEPSVGRPQPSPIVSAPSTARATRLGSVAPASAAPAPSPIAPASPERMEARPASQTPEPRKTAPATEPEERPLFAAVSALPAPSSPAPSPEVAGPAGAASPSQGPDEAVPAEAELIARATEALDAHFLRVWQAMTFEEQTRAANVLARLPPEARAAVVAELSMLPLHEAIPRAREMIHGRSTPTT